jgi:hypothetical protein
MDIDNVESTEEVFNPLDDPEERHVLYKAVNSFQWVIVDKISISITDM